MVRSQKKPTVSADNGPQLVTETKFMQQYRIAAAVHGGGDIVAIANGLGQVETFTIGTDGTVWNFYPDPASDTGYSAVSTGMVASSVVAGRDAAGRIVLFAANHLTLNYVRENGPGSATRWGAVQTATLPLPPSPITIAEVYVGEIGGDLYVGALTQFDSASPGNTYRLAYSLWSVQSGVFIDSGVNLSTLNCVWSGTNATTAEFTVLDKVYLGYKVATQSVVRYPFAAAFTSLSVATAVDDAKNNRYFAVLNDGNLYQMVGGSGGKPYSWAQVTQQQAFQQVAATADTQGAIQLFTLSSNHQLSHLAPSTQSSTGWTDPAAIQTNVALMGAAQLDQGNIELFLVGTAQATLTHMIRAADSGNWQVSALEVPTSGEVEEYISYSTDLMVYDAVGAPLPNTRVQVWAASQTQIVVNGASYTVDPRTPANLVTSATGALTITQQTGSLAIPALEINVPAISQGTSVAVEQYAGVQQDLATVTGSTLMDAKTADGSYLIPDEYRTPEMTDSMAKAFNECMALTSDTPGARQRAREFTRQGDKPGVRMVPKGSAAALRRLPPRAGRESHWQLDFSGGRVVYRSLTGDEAEALILEKRAKYTQHTPKSGTLGIFDWFEDIGDFIEGVVEGIIDIVDTVVTAIGDAVNAVITFIVDGVKYVFETVVTFVEQAFDLVEAFFAQVKVFFEKIFEWLGFLFSWNDILRTHEALSYTANQFLDFLPLSIAGVQRIFDNGIATVQSEITEVFDRLVAQVGGGSIGGYVDSKTPSEPQYASANSNNIVLNATVENAGSASTPVLGPGSNGPFDAVVKLLQQLVSSVEGSQAFQQALDYMTNLGGNVDEIFSQLISALLRVIQGLVQAMIAGVQAVVDAVLGLVQGFIVGIKSMLNAEWDIPFVSQFYSWLTDGSSLTLLDLISLILAIPATVLFKAINGAAPFPDQASVDAFKASFSAQTILANSGLGATGRAVAAAPAPVQSAAVEAWQQLLAIGGCLSFWGYGILTAAMDVQPTSGAGVVSPLVKLLTKITLGCEIVAQAVACPWIYGSGAPDCSTSEGAGRTFWIYECFGVALDAGFTWYEEAFPENNDTNWGIVVATLYGCGHTVMTGVLGDKLSGLGLASKITLIIPETCKFLKLTAVQNATKTISLIVICALDGLGLMASGILAFADFQGSSAGLAEKVLLARIPGAV